MKPRRNTGLVIGVLLSLLAFQGAALSAEQSDAKDKSTPNKSAKTLAQMIEEVRDSINEGWQKLANPKTVEPARDKVNEAYKELSDAAAAAVGSSDKSKKEAKDKKDK